MADFVQDFFGPTGPLFVRPMSVKMIISTGPSQGFIYSQLALSMIGSSSDATNMVCVTPIKYVRTTNATTISYTIPDARRLWFEVTDQDKWLNVIADSSGTSPVAIRVEVQMTFESEVDRLTNV